VTLSFDAVAGRASGL